MSKLIPTLVGAGFALAMAGAYANGSNKNPDDQDWQPQATEKGPYTKDKVGPDQAAKPGRAADRSQSSHPTMQPGPGGPTTDDQHARDPSAQGSQPGDMNHQSNDQHARDKANQAGGSQPSGQGTQSGQAGQAGQPGDMNRQSNDQRARDSQSGKPDQSSQTGGSDQTEQGKQSQIPDQSMPSVGHPAEGAATGQFGEKKFDQRTGQSDSSQPRTN